MAEKNTADLTGVTPHPEQDDLYSTDTEHQTLEPYEPPEAERAQVYNTIRRFKHYRDKRKIWDSPANEDVAFFNLKQWTDEEFEILNSRGQAPLICDQIYPRVTHLVSQLTASMPEFRVTGRDDKDVRKAQIFNELIQHVLYTNDFKEKQSEWVKDHCVYGVGALLVEYNKLNDEGDGEIGISLVHPFDLYVDPEAKEKDCSDAERIIIARNIGKNRALILVPREKEHLIKRLTNDEDDSTKYTGAGMHNEENVTLIDEVRDENKDHVMYIEEYMRVRVPFFTGVHAKAGWTTPDYIKEEFDAWKEDVAIADGIRTGAIEVIKTFKIRVIKRVVVGNVLVGEEILKTAKYPIVPLFFEHQRNPYSMGVVRGMKGFQKERNKRRSLMIAHQTTASNNKLLLMKGAVDDVEKMEEEWGRPNALIEINPIGGQKISDSVMVVPVSQMSNSLVQLEQQAKIDMDEWIGIDPLSAGISENVPNTAQATLAIDEFGKRRQSLYTRNIGFALRRLGKVVIDFIQGYWSNPNTIVRIVNPEQQQNQKTSGFMLNTQNFGLEGEAYAPDEITKVGDISVGRYDLLVVDGSTLPSNRWTLAQYYLEMFQVGLIDDISVWSKLDIVDREGLIKRKSAMAQMSQQLQSLQKELQKQGQLLTRETTKRQTAEQKTELANFKTWIGQQEVKVQKMVNETQLQLKSAILDKKNGSKEK